MGPKAFRVYHNTRSGVPGRLIHVPEVLLSSYDVRDGF